MGNNNWIETSGVARLRPVVGFFLLGMGILSLSRLALTLWKSSAVSEVNGWGVVLLQGVRVDIASLSLLLAPFAAALLLLPRRWFHWRGIALMGTAWLATVLTLLVGLELATPDFMAEYGLRPNRMFLEYLAYPREVFATLRESRPIQCVLLVLGIATAGVSGVWLARRWWPHTSGTEFWPLRVVLAFAVLLLGAMGVRSTLGHRPMNPAMIAFSTDATVNVLPLNSFYSLAHATRDWLRDEEGAAQLYGALPDDEVIAAIRADSGLPAEAFFDPEIPTLAARTPIWQGKPKNLVIVLEESMGAQFIGSLGGLPLSPEYDRLSEKGWALTRLYATGTRSVRGIEAVLSGFFPTPAQAVVKRSRSQQDFFTLAGLLRQHGYDATFYYGGESHFDNMRGFFLGNGFTRVIDQNDYKSPQFVGSWGVSDEDLFARADEEFNRLHAQGTPFFGFVFTSSNHDPFEFPDGKIELYETPKQTRNNAVKYADHALGEFFKRAMDSAYWDDTVFLVVADHDSRVLGQDLVPIDNFHIPGLILGAGIEPRLDDRIASQIDLAPTLLSLIGISDPTPMPGRNLADPALDLPGRAIMQYDRNFAWMQGDDVVIFQPEHTPQQYRYQQGQRMQPQPLDPVLAEHAKPLALWGSLAYDHGWYRLPQPVEQKHTLSLGESVISTGTSGTDLPLKFRSPREADYKGCFGCLRKSSK